MKIITYKTSSDKDPVRKFIQSLDKKVRAKVLGCLKKVELYGVNSTYANFRQIKGKLWEIKIKISEGGYRLFYFMLDRDLMILLHVYKKESQKAPQKELKIAFKRMYEVLNE